MTFNPAMMTVAREAAGLTQAALAHAVGVSQGRVSRIEHGLEEPSSATAERMADELRVQPDFFLQSYAPIGEGLVDFFHRRRQSLPAKPLKRAHALANIFRFEIGRLFGSIELVDVAAFPTFPSEQYTPVEAAEAVRATWRLPSGPLPDLVRLIEAAGVPVVRVPLFHEKLGALSMPGANGRHIVLLNGLMSASNLRFGLAHELGHLVMHGGDAGPDLESEADEFASALLMPARDIARDMRGLKFASLGTIKRTWHVSLAAAIRRARDIDAITERQYRTFNMQLNQLPGGRKHEPGEFEYEEPALVRSIFDHYMTVLGYSFDDLAQKVLVAPAEMLRERYYGIPAKDRLRSVGRGDNLVLFPLPGPTRPSARP